MKNLLLAIFISLLFSCANKALETPVSVEKAENLAEAKNQATSVHLTKCTWPTKEEYVQQDSLEEYLFSFEAVVNKHFKPCYLRHNDWVDTQIKSPLREEDGE